MGFRALRAARTPGISTFLYMHGPSLSGHWYPARRAAATADPDDSSVNEPFLVADSLLLFSPPNASQAKVRLLAFQHQKRSASLPTRSWVQHNPWEIGMPHSLPLEV